MGAQSKKPFNRWCVLPRCINNQHCPCLVVYLNNMPRAARARAAPRLRNSYSKKQSFQVKYHFLVFKSSPSLSTPSTSIKVNTALTVSGFPGMISPFIYQEGAKEKGSFASVCTASHWLGFETSCQSHAPRRAARCQQKHRSLFLCLTASFQRWIMAAHVTKAHCFPRCNPLSSGRNVKERLLFCFFHFLCSAVDVELQTEKKYSYADQLPVAEIIHQVRGPRMVGGMWL